MKRTDGGLKETTWEDALGIIADKLKLTGKNAGFISVAGIENEDALALKKLARDIVKTENYDTTASLYSDANSLKNSQKAEIDKADLFVLVDLNPSQWERVLPALDAAIRRRVNRGAKLIVINIADTKIADVAALNLKGDEITILKQIAKALISKGLKAESKIAAAVKDVEITEESEKAATIIAGAKEALFFTSPSLFDASANIALIKGKVISVGLESNARGVSLMGLTTEGKTYLEMTGSALSKGQSFPGAVKLLYAVGEVPLKERPDGVEFLIVQNSHLTELAKEADVVLPSATFLESAGTIIDYTGRLKYLPKVLEPQGESKSHKDIFIAIAKVMGAVIKRPTESEINKAAKAKTKLSFSPFVEKEKFHISPNELIESINASVINGSRILWLKETEKTVSA